MSSTNRIYRVLILGDFSARGVHDGASTPKSVDERSIHNVDIDNLDQIVSRFRPSISVLDQLAGDSASTIEIQSLDDFHPDSLFARLDILTTLREARDKAKAGELDSESMAFLTNSTDLSKGTTDPVETETPPIRDDESDADTLERLMGPRPSRPSQPARPSAEVDLSTWLKQLVQPHMVPAKDARNDALSSCDEMATGILRHILHHPHFQSLESLWQSVHSIVRETDDIELGILDISQRELAAEFLSNPDWRDSGLYRALTRDGRRWSLMAADFSFCTGGIDVLTLASLGGLAAELQTPFLAAATPEVCGCQSVHELPEPHHWSLLDTAAAQTWSNLRSCEMAHWIGLLMPRVLLRLPYGNATDPIDSFPFEEMSAPDNHQELLWGNPALAAVRLLARSVAYGAEHLAGYSELEDLPCYLMSGDEGPRMKACAEVHLSDKAAEAIQARGVMPMVSHRNRASAKLLGWQSVSEPPRPLAISKQVID